MVKVHNVTHVHSEHTIGIIFKWAKICMHIHNVHNTHPPTHTHNTAHLQPFFAAAPDPYTLVTLPPFASGLLVG